jgi:hypothetical protein
MQPTGLMAAIGSNPTGTMLSLDAGSTSPHRRRSEARERPAAHDPLEPGDRYFAGFATIDQLTYREDPRLADATSFACPTHGEIADFVSRSGRPYHAAICRPGARSGGPRG